MLDWILQGSKTITNTILHLLVTISCACFSYQLHALTCFFTVAKDNCWLNYDLTITLTDLDTHKPVTTITVPKGQSWGRINFTCQPNQKLMYTAQFQPIIWQTDANTSYRGTSLWGLPAEMSTGQTAWALTVCFSADFAEVPIPPEATGHCQCNVSSIPPASTP